MKKNLILLCLALAVCLGLSVLAPEASAAYAPAVTSNLGCYEYSYGRWASPVSSYLVAQDDGTFTRVEYTGQAVTVETYDRELHFVDGFSIQMELPIFGGFHSGKDYNFLVFGQKNPDEKNSVEVVRVVSYTKNWKRVGAASLRGANTYIPFDAGSLRFAEYGGYLYIRTAHEMYASSDGYHHQANMMLNVRISDMTITDSLCEVASIDKGYVSHSFNQFIATDGKNLIAVDHGDAYPRSVVLTRYLAPAGQDKFLVPTREDIGNGYFRWVYAKSVDVLPITGRIGANDTGVALGGFQVSDSSYLIAGNTVSQKKGADLVYGQRNIFVSATGKAADLSKAATTVTYLTTYTDADGVEVSNPHFVRVSSNKYAVLWTEYGSKNSGLRIAFVNGKGVRQGSITTVPGYLSDCSPVVADGKLVWYYTRYSTPAFFVLDPAHPECPETIHNYTYSFISSPDYDTDGALSCICTICGSAGENVVIPAIGGSSEYTLVKTEISPTCTESGLGKYNWSKLADYDITQRSFSAEIPALGHSMTYNAGVKSTCIAGGTLAHWDCSRCSRSYADKSGSTELTDLSAPIDPKSHTGRTTQVNVEPSTCTTQGYTGDSVCRSCGQIVAPGTAVPLADHDYRKGRCTVCGGEDPIFVGDIDRNGRLSVVDMIRLRSIVLDGGGTAESMPYADLNGDNLINATDLVLIRSLILSA